MKKVLLFALLIASLVAPAQQLTSGMVLSKLRSSLGHEKSSEILSSGGLMLRGDCTYMGVKGTYSLLCDGGGDFVEEVVSELGQVVGWDGKNGWTVDFTGMPRHLDLEDLESEQAFIWIYNGRWLDKDSPFTTEVVSSDDKTVNLRLAMRRGVLQGNIIVDAQKWVPLKFTRHSSAGDDVWEFSNYKKQMGFSIATTMKNTNGGMTNSFSMKTVEKAPSFIRNPYEPRLAIPKDTAFDAAAPAEIEVKRAFTGHLLVHPKVNGKDVGWFIFDSGAGAMVIDPKIADEQMMPKIGEIPAVGVGGLVKSSFRRADTFQLGPATVKKPLMLDLDLSMLNGIFGVKVAGICGYDFIARSVIEVNLGKPSIAVYNPSTYKLAKGAWGEIFQDGKHPIVKAKFEGDREGWFRLDTGASNSLVLHTPTVDKFKLLENRKTTNNMLGGVGGMVQAKNGKIEYFEIAGHRFTDQYVDFSLSKDGPFSDPYTFGNIGQKFLMPFVIVFDYQHRRMAFIDQWKQ